MARLEIDDFKDLDEAFKRIAEMPDAVKDKALKAMADVAAPEIKSTGESMGVRDRESSTHILDSIKLSKPKTTASGGYMDINFSGNRTRNGITTRNDEIAYVNEYGRNDQDARPFIGTAMNKAADKIAEAGAKVLWDYIEKNF